MKNTLTIHWKNYLGERMTPCPRPQQETFKGVATLEAAYAILNRRVKENMAYAVYNGEFLVKADKKIKVVDPVVADQPESVIPVKKQNFFDKVSNGFKNLFSPKKMFSRQKH